MSEQLLDKNCEHIFLLLLLSDKPLRFNKLHDTLNKLEVEMTAPTLIKHLNHLRTRRIILRQKTGKQSVSYTLNWQKFDNSKESLNTKELLLRTEENKKRFNSFPMNEQIMYVTNIFTLVSLYRLKLAVQYILKPKEKYDATLAYLLTDKTYGLFKKWLLQNCKESEENARTTLNMIERNIQHFTKILFDKMPKITPANL